MIFVRHDNHKPCISPEHGLWNYQSNEKIKTKFVQLSAQTLVVTKISFFYFAEQWENRCFVEPTSINVFVVCAHRYGKEYRKKEPLKKL